MNKKTTTLLGPFKQILPMVELSDKGPLKDEQLIIIEDGGIVVQDEKILKVGTYSDLLKKLPESIIEPIETEMVALPGFIDAHTHICFAGTRSFDYAARNNGKTYLEISKEGGGIWSTVKHTRAASQEELTSQMIPRMQKQLANGITTIEVKSGYGLNAAQELKMLRAINNANKNHPIDLIPTCLAAHIIPKEHGITEEEYLNTILNDIEPIIADEKLCNRFDIFIEDGAFSEPRSIDYLNELKSRGYEITVHGDQFNAGGSKVAIQVGAISVDHLEASGKTEISALANSNVIPVALPGASIGLGCDFTPARKLLDQGCSLAIASDWNPGSAPQGNLLSQAALLGTFQKLSTAEVLSGITYRAANALGLSDRGKIEKNKTADIIAFPCHDYREILYNQGELKVKQVWKKGIPVI